MLNQTFCIVKRFETLKPKEKNLKLKTKQNLNMEF